MKLAYSFSACVLLLAISGNATALDINVNGNPAEWFDDPATWAPVSGVNAYIEEDQCTALNPCAGGYLNPGWGNQRYDVEFLAATWNATSLSILVVTGLPKNNTPYAPGDIAIDFGQDGTYDYGIETTGGNAGNVYTGITWDNGLWGPVSDPTSIISGSLVAGSSQQLAYSTTPFTGYGNDASAEHYAIEATVSLDHFSEWGQDFTLHWTMNCGNDALDLPVSVPEPSTIALLGLGLIGIGAARKLKRH